MYITSNICSSQFIERIKEAFQGLQTSPLQWCFFFHHTLIANLFPTTLEYEKPLARRLPGARPNTYLVIV